VTDPENCKYKL